MYLWLVLIIATTCKGDNPNVKNYVASVSQLFKGIPEELITSFFFLRENSCSHYLSALSFFNGQYFFKYFCVFAYFFYLSFSELRYYPTSMYLYNLSFDHRNIYLPIYISVIINILSIYLSKDSELQSLSSDAHTTDDNMSSFTESSSHYSYRYSFIYLFSSASLLFSLI